MYDTDYYNEDAQLGGAINDAVTMAGRVASWPKVLQALTKELNIDLPRLLTASVVKLQPKVANPVAVGAIALLSTHITELGLPPTRTQAAPPSLSKAHIATPRPRASS